MRALIELLAGAGFLALTMGSNIPGLQARISMTAPASWLLSITITPVAAAGPVQGTTPPPCPDPMAIVKTFYDANDASRFDESLDLFTEDATLFSWAEGVNGYHARERHLIGKKEIRPALGTPGFRRIPNHPDGPIYHETRVKVSGDRVTFILEPDRLRPNGKPYNPYKVEVVFVGCKIRSLTVIDLVTWL